jgi:fermentation-respiration switch protein FrsA (DUF1100 family)
MAGSIATVLLGIALLGGLLYLQQPSMIFFPHATLSATPADWGMAYEDVNFPAADGAALHGWYIPREGARQVVLFLHGNAGNISHRGESVAIFHALGLDVFIFDYRGYGRSSGKPSEAGLYDDARGAWRYLTGQKGFDGRGVVIFGRSLGGVVAAKLASEVSPGAVIIESAFSSAREVASAVFPVLSYVTPLRFEFDAAAYIRHVRAPVLVLHSREDEIMPFELGRRLYQAANEPKEFVELRGDHNGGFLLSQPGYGRALRRFINESPAVHAEGE